jgi:hypothetical protein
MVGAIIGQCEGRVAMFEASAGQQDEEDEGNTTSSSVHIGGGAKRNGIQSNHGIGGGASQCVASRVLDLHGYTEEWEVDGCSLSSLGEERFAAEGVA